MSASENIESGTWHDIQGERSPRAEMFRPACDIIERDQELEVLVDMPGLSTDDIEIQFDDGRLTLHGKVRRREPEGTTYLLREYGVGDFFRTFKVSEQIDARHIKAEYQHGVLIVRLPKATAARARKVSVQGR